MNEELRSNLLFDGRVKLVELLEDLERPPNKDIAYVVGWSKRNFCENPGLRQRVIDYIEKELGRKVLFAREDKLDGADDVPGKYILYEDVPEGISETGPDYVAWMEKVVSGKEQ